MKVTLELVYGDEKVRRYGEHIEPYENAFYSGDPLYVAGFGVCQIRSLTSHHDFFHTHARIPTLVTVELMRVKTMVN
jgi:hypothetical protein